MFNILMYLHKIQNMFSLMFIWQNKHETQRGKVGEKGVHTKKDQQNRKFRKTFKLK